METATTMLADLTPQNDRDTVLARVARIWESINKHNGLTLHTNVLLMDQEGNQMVAVIRNNQKHVYLPMLEENGVYIISNFKVVQGPKQYRTVDVEYSINFFYRTKIKKQEDTCLIPRYKFELQEFASVGSLVGNVRLFIDVLGMVRSCGSLERRSNGAQKMDIMLNNDKMEQMVVTLWEDKALQFQESLAKEAEGAVFVVITGLLAKKFSDAPSLSSTDATKTFLNIDYKPLVDLKQALSHSLDKPIHLLPPPRNENFITTEGNNAQELLISSILDVKIPAGKEVVRCICHAKIIGILNGNGWYYDCCPKCAKAVRPGDGKYQCVGCGHQTEEIKQRFRIVAQVEDKSGTTTLTLFNKEAEQLVGVPLQKILATRGEDGDMQEVPPQVKNLIGRVCFFHIKVTTYNTNKGNEEYTVTRVLEDPQAGPSEEKNSSASVADVEDSENVKKKQKVSSS